MFLVVLAPMGLVQSGASFGKTAGTYSLYLFFGCLLASLAQSLPKQLKTIVGCGNCKQCYVTLDLQQCEKVGPT